MDEIKVYKSEFQTSIFRNKIRLNCMNLLKEQWGRYVTHIVHTCSGQLSLLPIGWQISTGLLSPSPSPPPGASDRRQNGGKLFKFVTRTTSQCQSKAMWKKETQHSWRQTITAYWPCSNFLSDGSLCGWIATRLLHSIFFKRHLWGKLQIHRCKKEYKTLKKAFLRKKLKKKR